MVEHKVAVHQDVCLIEPCKWSPESVLSYEMLLLKNILVSGGAGRWRWGMGMGLDTGEMRSLRVDYWRDFGSG